MRTPSITTLHRVFGDEAKEAKKLLRASRRELSQTPAGAARVRECWHPPSTGDIRMHCLDAISSTFGVESFELKGGGYCEYLNVGEMYAETLVRMPGGRYRVACVGDLIERYGV